MPSRKRQRTSTTTAKKRSDSWKYYPYGKFSKSARNKFQMKHKRGSAGSRAMFGKTYQDADDLQKAMRLALRYKGEGDYWDEAMTGAAAGGTLGGVVAAPFGPAAVPMGAAIGGAAGGLLGLGTGLYDQYFGEGDYGRTSNQIIAGSRPPISVNASNDRTGDILIRQTEFIGNVRGSENFTLDSYEINPGLDKMFPFLSQLANNYEMYEWSGLMVAYKPTSGEGATNNAVGKVVIATNYDPRAPDFGSSMEMQNYDYASVGKPSQTIIHGIETAKSQLPIGMKYVRNGVSSKDLEFTDIGKLFIATEGMPSNEVVGELHVTYTVKLSRAKLFASLGNFGKHQRMKYVIDDVTFTNQSVQVQDIIFTAPTSVLSGTDDMYVDLVLNDRRLTQGSFKLTVHGHNTEARYLTTDSIIAYDHDDSNFDGAIIMHGLADSTGTALPGATTSEAPSATHWATSIKNAFITAGNAAGTTSEPNDLALTTYFSISNANSENLKLRIRHPKNTERCIYYVDIEQIDAIGLTNNVVF